MIGRGERLRVGGVFGVLGLVALVVTVRLCDLQVVRAESGGDGALPLRTRALPAPRGTLLDRSGEPLAFDRPVYEIRAEVERVPGLPDDKHPLDVERLRAAKDHLVGDLVWALGRDEIRFGDPKARDELRAHLESRVVRALERALRTRRTSIDVLVERTVDDAGAIAALESLDFRAPARREGAAPRGYRLYLHKILRFERVYAEPERAVGVVGTVRDGPLRVRGVDGRVGVVDDRVPVSGLECLRVLEPGARGQERRLVDALNRALWTGRRTEPMPGAVVRTTIDRELQVRADIEIEAAADAVTAHYESPPEWGAMVLVHVPTGGILAAASYSVKPNGSRSRDRYGAFGPTQRVFQPGSVVKPLHVAMALDRGLVDWSETIDCSPGYLAGSDHGARSRRPRVIKDSHPNGVMTPRDVLVRSSNIGAIRLGLRLGPEGMEEYLRHYRFGTATDVLLPGELGGSRPKPIPSLNRTDQYVYAGPSVLFGYAIDVTALQVARAYRSFLLRRECGLRIVDGVEVDGRYRRLPPEPETEPFLGQQALDLVKDALVAVVEDEHGTARRVGTWLRRLRAEGRPYLEIAGKTGTSQYAGVCVKWNGETGRSDIRTSSFVGFTPVREPRYLVVCVLQKAGAGSFYGGTYAAPAASRLLVRALEREAAGPAAPVDRSGSLGVAIGTGPGGPDNQKRR